MKKHLFKIVFAMIIISIITAAFMAVNAFALSDAAGGKCGDGVFWELNDLGVLRIYGEGEMEEHGHESSYPWFDHRASVEEIVIEDGVTNVGMYAFYDYGNVRSLSLSRTVETIGVYSFYNCVSMTDVILGDGIKQIGLNAFLDCTHINSVYLDSIDFWFGIVFDSYRSNPLYYADNLYINEELCSDIIVPLGINRIEAYAFYDCDIIKSVYIPSTVSDIESYAFYECNNLGKIIFEGDREQWDRINISSAAIPAKTEIVFNESGNGSGDASWSFDNGVLRFSGEGEMPVYSGGTIPWKSVNNSTVKVVIGEGITSVSSYAFADFTVLTEVILSESVEKIGTHAFDNCDALISVDLNNSTPEVLSYAFYDCDSLKSVNGSEGVGNVYTSAFQNCKSLSEISISDSATVIEPLAFDDCRALYEISIGKNVNTIGYDAFTYTVLYQDKVYWEDGVLYIGDYLIKADTGIAEEYTVKDGTRVIADNAFKGIVTLKAVTLPDSVISIGKSAFYQSGLTELNAGSGLKYIGVSSFANCDALIKVSISAADTEIDSMAFKNCHSLVVINSSKGLGNIGSKAFEGCDILRSLAVGEKATQIGTDPFIDCISLTVKCYENSYIHLYLENNKIPYKFLIPAIKFNDVSPNAWYYDAVCFCVKRDIMQGNSEEIFDPNGELTREQLVTILSRIAGADLSKYTRSCFKDVKIDSWYGPAVIWANEKGYVKGTGNGLFGVGDTINREAFATVLFRYAKNKRSSEGMYTALNRYSDYGSVSQWAREACIWAVNNGILSSTSGDSGKLTFSPKMAVTRAQAAKIFMSYDHNVEPVNQFVRGRCGYAVNWEFDYVTGLLRIYGKGAIEDGYKGWDHIKDDISSVSIFYGITGLGGSCFENCINLNNILIPESVTNIGANAFKNCSSLTDIYLPDTVTAIGYGVFEDCSELINVTLSPMLSSIPDKAFYGCSWLMEIDIPYNVKALGDSCFMNCRLLESVTFNPDNGAYNIASIGDNAFMDCDLLTAVGIPNSVTYLGVSAFESCDMLNTAVLGSGITVISNRLFYDCRELFCISVDYTNAAFKKAFLDTPDILKHENSFKKNIIDVWGDITEIGEYAFYNCKKFSRCDLASKENLKKIGRNAFNGCTALSNINLPTDITEIGEKAFNSTFYMNDVRFWYNGEMLYIGDYLIMVGYLKNEGDPKDITSCTVKDSVTCIADGAFENCSNLTTVNMPDKFIYFNKDVFNDTALEGADDASKDFYVGPYLISASKLSKECLIGENTKYICDYAFADCTYIKDVMIPEGVIRIGENAFDNCTSLLSIKIPDSIEYVGEYAFNNCIKLDWIDLGYGLDRIGQYCFNRCFELSTVEGGSSVRIIAEGAFKDCNDIKTVEFKNIEEIGVEAFYGCEYLTEFKYTGSKIKRIGNRAFYGCIALSTVDINTAVAEAGIGESAFEGCISISKLNISGMSSLGVNAFKDCISLTDVIIPDTVKRADDGLFTNCTGIKSLVIGRGLNNISNRMLYGCSGLETVIIPSNVNSVGEYSFYGCSALRTVTVDSSSDNSKIDINSFAFANCSSLETVTFNVRAANFKLMAFYNSDNVVIECYNDTDIHKYCVVNNITYRLIEQNK